MRTNFLVDYGMLDQVVITHKLMAECVELYLKI